MLLISPQNMILASVLKHLLLALRYPAFPSVLVGEYQVGAIQTRIPDGPACQIHYPTAAATSASTRGKKVPYIRPQAIPGLADYTRQNPSLLEYLSLRQHPCIMGAAPLSTTTTTTATTTSTTSFPIVIFSHGLGGCMEMYTNLCQQIASQGYWVVAVEHADGSGAYAETSTGEPIYYQRPDDTPYSRSKVVNFRKDFLRQRMQEIDAVLQFLVSSNGPVDHDQRIIKDPLLEQVLEAADTQQGFHFVGHSFGGATMVQFLQQQQQQQPQKHQQQYKVESLSVLDCWAFSLPDSSLELGIVSTPMLSILSEAWLTNPETDQVQLLLQNSPQVTSWYIPHSVHASFSDVVLWLPGFVTRTMRLRGPSEGIQDTIRTAAIACVQHFQQQPVEKVVGLKEFPIKTTTTTTTISSTEGETVLTMNAGAS